MSNSFWYTGQILRKSYPKFLCGPHEYTFFKDRILVFISTLPNFSNFNYEKEILTPYEPRNCELLYFFKH